LSTIKILNRIRERMDTTPEARQGAATDNPQTEDSPSAEVWALLRILFREQRRRFLIAASELDLHPAQAGALLQLESPLPMHELASLLACDNSNVTGLVDRLEARDLVARQASSDDRRVKRVVLTPAGRRLRRQLLARVATPVARLERLPVAEQRQLRDLLQRLVGE
jgi:MarR family transcriptional regulator, organic hydroperoxide resistance regulator